MRPTSYAFPTRRRARFWFIELLLLLWIATDGGAHALSTAVYTLTTENSASQSPGGTVQDTVQNSGQDTSALYVPVVEAGTPARVLIAAMHADSARIGEADEAFLLWNVGGRAQPLAGWQIVTRTRRATFPADTALQLLPGARLWCAAQSGAFREAFGAWPACSWDDPPGAFIPVPEAVVPLEGGLLLANAGGYLQVQTAQGRIEDTLLYGNSELLPGGWEGPPAQLYNRGGIGLAGQIWHRKQDPVTGLPVDSDLAQDWAGDLADVAWGRRVRRPGWLGWDADTLSRAQAGTAESWITVAVAPEGLYAPLAHYLHHAQSTIDLSLFTFEHPELAHLLAQRAAAGVRVRILLEGGPPGGITLLQRWTVAQMAQAGVEVYYSAVHPLAPRGYATRYRYAHAKYGIIDGHTALVGTENWARDAMPVPGKQNTPPGGRRGYYLLTGAPPVVHALQRLFTHDYAPQPFWDLLPYTADHVRYGAPPADYLPPPPPWYRVDAAPFAAPLTVAGPARFVVVSAPEHALRPDDGLHALLQRAGAGDAIWVQQLYEHKHWGAGNSNAIADPNPRLQMLIDAARRGAQVRILLDGLFDDADALRSNAATALYLHTLAAAEGLDIQVRVGNPTGGGIHAKLFLFQVGGEQWSAVGSLNGSETSHKINREVVLLVNQPVIYDRLLAVFLHDWAKSQQ